MEAGYGREAVVVSQEMLLEGIFSLWIRQQDVAKAAVPGQFINLYCRDESRLLPRPISICETVPEEGLIRMVYRIAGKGTEEFSRLRAGDPLRVLGPLGNGFPMHEVKKDTHALIVGGGIGIPPLLLLSQKLDCDKTIVCGYRSKLFLTQELSREGEVLTATEDGSSGTKGTVLDCIRENRIRADIVFACGPLPMLRALKEWGQENSVPVYLSMEQKMACGVGACLACVCRTTQTDAHSGVHNARVCKEGPVFSAEELSL